MPDTDEALLAIGELSRLTATASSALRYYERIGLLAPAERIGGRRRYSPSSAESIVLIRLYHLYQDAGFTLAEIRRLLTEDGRPARDWSRLAAQKIDELDSRIAEAQRAKDMLEHGLHCTHRDLFACPNFRAAIDAKRQALEVRAPA